jgi:hypothetical protein
VPAQGVLKTGKFPAQVTNYSPVWMTLFIRRPWLFMDGLRCRILAPAIYGLRVSSAARGATDSGGTADASAGDSALSLLRRSSTCRVADRLRDLRPVRAAWTALTQDAPAAASQIHLVVPPDWRIGDEVFLPDAHQVTPRAPIRRERRIFIAGIAPGVATLSKPLDFEHRSVTDPGGIAVLAPRVATLTRNIVVMSENAHGTRGHTVNISSEASSDIRYTAFYGLGRTLAKTLDNTTADETGVITHIGTNQIAKYPPTITLRRGREPSSATSWTARISRSGVIRSVRRTIPISPRTSCFGPVDAAPAITMLNP